MANDLCRRSSGDHRGYYFFNSLFAEPVKTKAQPNHSGMGRNPLRLDIISMYQQSLTLLYLHIPKKINAKFSLHHRIN